MAQPERADNNEQAAFELAKDFAYEAKECFPLVPGLIEPDQRVIVFGDPGVGKSLFAGQAAFSLAKRCSFFGIPMQDDAGAGYDGGHVAYLWAEGSRQRISNRLRALEIENGLKFDDAKMLISGATNFANRRAVKNLIAELTEKLGVVDILVSDTFPANHSLNENQTADATKLIRGLKHISEQLGCAHLLLTHPGHRNTDRPRGSRAFVGDVDAVFKIHRTKSRLIAVTAKKIRDDEDPSEIFLRIKKIDLGIVDRNGKAVTAPVLEVVDDAPAEKQAQRLSAPQLIALQALRNAIEDKGISPPDELRDQVPTGHLITNLTTWRNGAFELGFPGKTEAGRRQGFKRAIQALLDTNEVETNGGNFFWVARKQTQHLQHLSALSPDKLNTPLCKGGVLSGLSEVASGGVLQ